MREARYWLFSLIAAACLIVLLGLHLFLMHLNTLGEYLGLAPQEPLEYTAVIARGKSLGWVVGYLALLSLALYHGLYGLRSVLSEIISPNRGHLITIALTVLGFIAFIIGTYAVIATYITEGI